MANCSKIKYSSESAATRVVLSIVSAKNAHLKPKLPVAVYPCVECRAWHLTSQKHRRKFDRWNVKYAPLSAQKSSTIAP